MSKGYEQDFCPMFKRSFVVRQYYLHTRNCIYYVQFTDMATQKRLSAVSTGITNRNDAIMVVALWLKEGIPQRQTRHEDKPNRSLETVLNTNQVLLALKQIEFSAQDISKIEKTLKDRGLVETIIKKGSEEAELITNYLSRFWDYD
jgi:hypothetical protein